MKRSRVIVCTSLLLISPLSAFCQDEVSGTFTAKGKTTEFRHVYAFWKPRLMDESKIDLYVLLSDQPIAADTLPQNDDGVAKMAGLVRDDKIHALELHFEADSNKLFVGEEGAVYHGAVAMARQGQTGAFHYEPVSGDATTRAGKVSSDKETVDLRGWSCNASFKAAVPAKP
jgi:hypothetical protein